MKKLLIGLLLCTGVFAFPEQATAQYASVSFQLFYDDLSPYGMWISNPTYGYVWVPNVGAGFEPYSTGGYWVFTDAGWTWVSDYSWGWAPFHYGRWYYDPYYGYEWIPGTEWGPAWVGWRRCEGYYGWTALGPGISWGIGYASYNPPPERWVFVRERDFGRGAVSSYRVSTTNNVTIIKNSTVINNTVVNKGRNETYIAGPDKLEVQKTSGRTVNPTTIHENSQPGVKPSGDKLLVYRPKVESNVGEKRAAPTKVFSESEARPIIEKRNVGASNGHALPVTKPTDNQRAQPAPAGKPNIKETGTPPPAQTREKKVTSPPINNNAAPRSEPQRINPQPKNGNQQRVNPEPRTKSNDFNQSPPQNRAPVQPREVSPPQRREQAPQRVVPNEPRMRGNEVHPNNVQPVQPHMAPQQPPMQRVNPNPPMQQPHMNPGGGQRVPVGGGHKPH